MGIFDSGYNFDNFGFGSRYKTENTEEKKAYEEASGINLEEQRKIWDERAKGYWGEYKVFSVLFRELDFPNKILVNVELPIENGRSTEIDLLLFAPTGVYVFEVKHYSGKIYGGYNSATWTKYYKHRDSVTFDNPLKQNEYHISQLKRYLPGVNIYSYVVFTRNDAESRADGRYPGNLTVTSLDDLAEKIRGDFAGRAEIYTPEQIEGFFKLLRPFSPMETVRKEHFKYNQDILPFSEFAEAMLHDLEAEKRKAKRVSDAELLRQTNALKHEREEVQKLGNEYHGIVKAAEDAKDKAEKALKEFERNFTTVTPYESGWGVINRDCFEAEVKFEASDSFVNTTNMYFKLRNKSKELWIETCHAWFLVGAKNGTVQKYLIEKHLPAYISHSHSLLGPLSGHGDSFMIRLFNVSVEDIRFIKLANAIVKDSRYGSTNVAPGIEFEIYTAPDVESVYGPKEPAIEIAVKEGVFELSPKFLKSDITLEKSSDGEGCDIKFSLHAATEEVGFDIMSAAFVIGTKDGAINDYPFKKYLKNLYSGSVMPLSKTSIYVMHLKEFTNEDVVFIKLKGLRIFRKERWQNDNLLPDAEFDVYPREEE